MKSSIRLSCVGILLGLILASPGQAAVTLLEPHRVQHLIGEGSGLWLIDVRGPAAFERGHAEGSLNIPEESLSVQSFPRQKLLVLIDGSLGALQARRSAELLAARGQEKVFVVAGGLRGWERAGLPLVGPGSFWEHARVLPGELEAARAAGTALEVFDLRTEAEQAMGPVDQTTVFDGVDFPGRLQALRKLLQGRFASGGASQPAKNPTVVVILPTRSASRTIYRDYFWDLDGDVRVLEGAYALTVAGREQRTLTTGECATCPGGN